MLRRGACFIAVWSVTVAAACGSSTCQASDEKVVSVSTHALLQGVAQRNSLASDAGASTTTTTTALLIFPLEESDQSTETVNDTNSTVLKDCILTEWSEWGDCEEPPADGATSSYLRKRIRFELQPQLEGGKPCEAKEQVLSCTFGGYDDAAANEVNDITEGAK
mmetsp:Transcript_40699/g.93545  ORF Transcript_40699/g.93545 Transcript_40699/m.93545 type:complete len:164 (-) Transcript_40699:36-527(-)